MNIASSTRSANHSSAAAVEVEGELRAILKSSASGIAHAKSLHETTSASSGGNPFIQQILAPSLKEIDRAIAQLQKMRDFLQSEGQRIEREMAQYAQLGEAAMKSTKIIAENMAHRSLAG